MRAGEPHPWNPATYFRNHPLSFAPPEFSNPFVHCCNRFFRRASDENFSTRANAVRPSDFGLETGRGLRDGGPIDFTRQGYRILSMMVRF
jgi:hypothetical protein